jgi:hypothetical protein
MRITDARMALIPPQRRPHYPPKERMAILELKAAHGWSLAQTAKAFLVTAETIASWMKRLDEDGPDALVQMPVPVNKFPQFVQYVVQCPGPPTSYNPTGWRLWFVFSPSDGMLTLGRETILGSWLPSQLHYRRTSHGRKIASTASASQDLATFGEVSRSSRHLIGSVLHGLHPRLGSQLPECSHQIGS